MSLVFVGATSAHAGDPREDSGFGSNPGNLRMFSYVPAGVTSPPPLIVVLHGCRQHAVAFARDAGWLAVSDSLKVALLLPEQKGLPPSYYGTYLYPWVRASLMWWYDANNQEACFNWFEPDDTRRDKGEALSIRQMIDTMIARYSIDRSRVYVVGLSAGGAMSAAMLAAYPERLAGGAIVAGVAVGCADTVSKALQCMQHGVDLTPAEWRRRVQDVAGAEARFPPISIWQGDADTTVIPLNQTELIKQWTAADGIAATPTRVEAGEPVTRKVYANSAGVTQVESVTVKGLGHAFPIRTDGGPSCGQPGDYVVAAGVCAAREISRYWGLTGGD